MKYFSGFFGGAVVLLLVGCATTPLALGPVGPGPASQSPNNNDGNGQLEVFSAVVGFVSGNPAWYLHTDYSIYTPQGKPLQRVNNTVDSFSDAPRVVSLPPGLYVVVAQAKGQAQVKVPVLIKAGQTTTVNLDNAWPPTADVPKEKLVVLPSGYPVGWRADASE